MTTTRVERTSLSQFITGTLGAGQDGYGAVYAHATRTWVPGTFEAAGAVAAHVLEADPHGQYALESALSGYAPLATANTFALAQTFSGGMIGGTWKPAIDSVAALTVQNAAGTADVAVFNTTNGRMRLIGDFLQLQISTADLSTNGFFSINAGGMTFYTVNDVPFTIATGNTNALIVRAGAGYDAVTVRGAPSQVGDYFQVETSGQLVTTSFKPVSDTNQRTRFLLYNTLETNITNYERLAIYADNPNNIFVIDTENGGSGTLRNLQIAPGSAYVAIGNHAPNSKLDVAGTVQADGLRLDVTPTAETPAATHTAIINLDGTNWKVLLAPA